MNNLVPDEWAEHRQGDVANFSNGKAYKLTEWEKVGTPVIRLQNLTGSGKNYYYSNLKLPDRQYCESGDLLYMWSATFGPHIWKGPKAIYHYHIWKVTCNEKDLTKSFLYQLLGYKTAEWLNQSNGMGILHITKGGMEELKLILPPLPEQQKIAAILTSVDEVIEKTQAQLDKLKDLKTAMMQELLTCGVGADGQPHTEFKNSPVGRIPKGWDCVQLESLLENSKNSMRSGPFGSSLLKHELVPDGHPYLGIDNVHIERFDNKFKRFVSDEKFEQLKRYAVKEGDVMITIMGTVGRSCVVPKNIRKALSSKHVWTMTFEQTKYIPALVCWQLNYSDWVKLQFKNESQGGVMASISSKTLKELWLPLPPIQEQKKIDEAHKILTETISIKETLLCKHKSLKKALMQDLLTGKVRVQVEQS